MSGYCELSQEMRGMRPAEVCPGARACDLALSDLQSRQMVKASLAALDAEAERLITVFGGDIERLQFHRDRLFWSNSIVRWRDLPAADRALAIAKEHSGGRNA